MSELSSWREEKQAAYLYQVVAAVEAGTPRASLFLELAGEAEKQAAIWAKLAHEAGLAMLPEYTPDMRTRLVAALLRRFGARPLRTVLSAMKVRGMSLYTHTMQGHTSQTPGGEMGKRHRGMGSGGGVTVLHLGREVYRFAEQIGARASQGNGSIARQGRATRSVTLRPAWPG